MKRPPFTTIRLTSPRQQHPAVAWVQQLINERSGKNMVKPPLAVDGIFGPETAAELEELLYRLGHPDPKPAIGPDGLTVLWRWSQGEKLPLDWRARRIAREKLGWKPGWGISWRTWKALHPGKYGDSDYDPADAADVMVGWAKAGWKESPAGSNKVPPMIARARELGVKPEFANMGYAWCQLAAYLSGLEVGGSTARQGLVEGKFWPLYTPYTLDYGRNGQYGHKLIPASQARKGDMALFNFGSKDPVQHVGRLLSKSGSFVTTVDGNTSTKSEDNGGAVMVRERPASTVVAYVRDS